MSPEDGLLSSPAPVRQGRPNKQKTNSNKGPGKRRAAAVPVSVAQSPVRVFFNPDTCKPFYHDLQWGEMLAGGRDATRGTVFTTK